MACHSLFINNPSKNVPLSENKELNDDQLINLPSQIYTYTPSVATQVLGIKDKIKANI